MKLSGQPDDVISAEELTAAAARMFAMLEANEQNAVHDAVRRDHELSSGAVAGPAYEEVMQAARPAIKRA